MATEIKYDSDISEINGYMTLEEFLSSGADASHSGVQQAK